MAEDIFKLLSRPGSLIILVFDPLRRYPIHGESLKRGHKIHGGEKIMRFSTESPFISETVRDRPMVTMER